MPIIMMGSINTFRGMLAFLQTESKVPDGLGFWGTCGRLLWILLNWPSHSRALNGTLDAADRVLLAAYLKIAYRPTLPYLSANFSPSERLEMLRFHDDFVRKNVGAKLFSELTDCPVQIWSEQIDGSVLAIALGGPCPHREGGFSLIFTMDAKPIYKSAFSFVDVATLGFSPVLLNVPSCPVIYVGQIQGFPGEYDSIKVASRKCHDVAPSDMLIAALLGVAATFEIALMAAVKFEHCLSYDRMTQKQASFHHGTFWQDHWGAVDGGKHYALKLPLTEKPLSEVKANHRGRTQVKRAFKHGVACQVEATLRARVKRWAAAPA